MAVGGEGTSRRWPSLWLFEFQIPNKFSVCCFLKIVFEYDSFQQKKKKKIGTEINLRRFSVLILENIFHEQKIESRSNRVQDLMIWTNTLLG
jgi:hypothetical protein